MRRLVFTHIQKAAGSSVNVFFEDIREQCGVHVLAFGGAPNGDLASPRDVLEKHGLDYREFDIVTGHIPFSAANACFGPALYTTVLREPVARLLSDFCSQPQNQGLSDGGLSQLQSALDMPASYAIDNLQVRMLCDDPRFDEPARLAMLSEAKHNLQTAYSLVGFAEDLDPFFSELSRVYGIPLPEAPVRINVSPPYLDKVSEEHRSLIARYNRLDAELYAWGRGQSFPRIAPIDRRETPGGKVVIERSALSRIPPLGQEPVIAS